MRSQTGPPPKCSSGQPPATHRRCGLPSHPPRRASKCSPGMRRGKLPAKSDSPGTTGPPGRYPWAATPQSRSRGQRPTSDRACRRRSKRSSLPAGHPNIRARVLVWSLAIGQLRPIVPRIRPSTNQICWLPERTNYSCARRHLFTTPGQGTRAVFAIFVTVGGHYPAVSRFNSFRGSVSVFRSRLF